MEFSLNVSLNSANSVTKIFIIAVKGLKAATSCVRDQGATTAPARHMCERQDLCIEPNLCFSDLSDCLNLLNSLNSVKILLHSGKTPMFWLLSMEYKVSRDL